MEVKLMREERKTNEEKEKHDGVFNVTFTLKDVLEMVLTSQNVRTGHLPYWLCPHVPISSEGISIHSISLVFASRWERIMTTSDETSRNITQH